MAVKALGLLALWLALVGLMIAGLVVGFVRESTSTMLNTLLLLAPTTLIGAALITEVLEH